MNNSSAAPKSAKVLLVDHGVMNYVTSYFCVRARGEVEGVVC